MWKLRVRLFLLARVDWIRVLFYIYVVRKFMGFICRVIIIILESIEGSLKQEVKSNQGIVI
jgi:hypothetical protein